MFFFTDEIPAEGRGEVKQVRVIFHVDFQAFLLMCAAVPVSLPLISLEIPVYVNDPRGSSARVQLLHH